METQNITLSIPKEVLRKAKLIAVQRQTSLSRLLTQALLEIVSNEEGYERHRRIHLALLERGIDLGTQGNISWKRDELHER
jgi:calcineurin-like phosphoesterase